jgi:cytochrome o ubiquinol oxidase operon protein cyoD
VGTKHPVAFAGLTIAKMDMHLLVVLVLAFAILIVILVIGGSLWIVANLNHNIMPVDQLMQIQW